MRGPQSLNLTRSVGELGNLLALFAYDATSLEAWRTADRKARTNGFSPVHVRKRLEDLGASAYVSRDRYSQLCEVATHAWPGLNPQGYSGDGTPRIGGVLQEIGAELTLNEIAIATSVTALYVARLLDLEADIRARFEHLAIKTITLLSDVQITNMPVVWERIDRARRETRSQDSHSG